jgi:hypothetical protein
MEEQQWVEQQQIEKTLCCCFSLVEEVGTEEKTPMSYFYHL